MSILSKPYFHNEDAAYAYVESCVWSNGRVCPHCGGVENSKKLRGKSTRRGVYKCYSCSKPFTVKVGTIFEASHIPLHKWLQAIYLMTSSKKGISSNQLHRTLEVTLKTAWFMSHRIREAMKPNGIVVLGGDKKIVEVDETYVGGKERFKHASKRLRAGRGAVGKQPVLTMLERGGKAHSVCVNSAKEIELRPHIMMHISVESHLMTDEGLQYRPLGKKFMSHDAVTHGMGEYVRDEVHTNTVEGYFGILKRGLTGVYQHCSPKYLDQYLAEFDFRYNNRAGLGVTDAMRAENVLKGVTGKRLTYAR